MSRLFSRLRDFHCAEDGDEPLEYMLIVAMVVLPLFVAVRWTWLALVHYYGVISFTLDMPVF